MSQFVDEPMSLTDEIKTNTINY
jgi:hypothetical protein